MSKISRREARRLQLRVAELEEQINQQHRSWSSQYPGGTHIGTIECAMIDADVRVKVARQLGHACVVTNDVNKLLIYALPLPKVTP